MRRFHQSIHQNGLHSSSFPFVNVSLRGLGEPHEAFRYCTDGFGRIMGRIEFTKHQEKSPIMFKEFWIS